MTAFGGKREKGALKEKKACMPPFDVFVEVVVTTC
jgi:hypothetical protein